MATNDQIRARIIAIVENNPGCTVASIQSEIRSEFQAACRAVIATMVADGAIKVRNGNNVFIVED